MWISVLNLNLETPDLKPPQKLNVFNFQLNCFSAIFDFTIWFCTSLSRETWSFELISQSFLFYAQQQKKVFKPSFSNPAFQNLGSNPTWFWKLEKNSFQTWKRPFLVYFKKTSVLKNAILSIAKCNILFQLLILEARGWVCLK